MVPPSSCGKNNRTSLLPLTRGYGPALAHRAAQGCLRHRCRKTARTRCRPLWNPRAWVLLPIKAFKLCPIQGSIVLFRFLFRQSCLSLLWIDDVAPIEVTALKAVNQNFSGRNIGCKRDIVHVAEAEHVDFIDLPALVRKRVPEK